MTSLVIKLIACAGGLDTDTAMDVLRVFLARVAEQALILAAMVLGVIILVQSAHDRLVDAGIVVGI